MYRLLSSFDFIYIDRKYVGRVCIYMYIKYKTVFFSHKFRFLILLTICCLKIYFKLLAFLGHNISFKHCIYTPLINYSQAKQDTRHYIYIYIYICVYINYLR